ncbi:hypothetical protein Tco_1394368 [Tanacetum coccineum]
MKSLISNKSNEPKTARKENGAPVIEDWVSESEGEDEPKFQTVKPNFTKIKFVKPKTNRKLIEQIRQDTYRSPRGNNRNWNQQMSQKLGSYFEMFNKACHVCGSFDHLKNDCNNWSGLILLNTARPVNTVQPRTVVNNAGPMKNVINNAYSTARRPFKKITAANNSNFTKKVNTVKRTRVNTTRPKAVAIKENKGNAVKASTCWGNPQQDLKDKGVIDNGCSRHMTGNRSYLTDYEEIDGGFVAFGGNSKGGKITRKEVNAIYDTPSHTKKIFANMKRQGKDFSGTVTPLFSSMLAQQADMGEGSGQPTDPQHTSTIASPSQVEPITVPSSLQPKKTHRPRKAKRATKISQSSGPIPLVANETVTKKREDRMEKAATTASSIEAEQDSGNINRTKSMATLNEPSPQGTGSGSGPRCQDTILEDSPT